MRGTAARSHVAGANVATMVGARVDGAGDDVGAALGASLGVSAQHAQDGAASRRRKKCGPWFAVPPQPAAS